MSNEQLVFSTHDPFKRKVVLKTETWNTHIITGHPEMRKNELAVKKTIENPDLVFRSTWNPSANLYFAKVPESTYPHLYTRVIIGYDENNEGNVKTALFSKSIGGVDQEALLYGKPKH